MFNFNFSLNEMQKEAYELQGKNIVLSAPTGSGKTEAILLNCSEKAYFYLLPTITSCIFMFNRLKDFGQINLEIKTSLKTDKFIINKSKRKIIISTPDPLMIEYLKTGRYSTSNLILDELDNYPLMVQSALLDCLSKPDRNSHTIVASATLSKELQLVLDNTCKKISYRNDINFIKHKVEHILNHSDVVEIVSKNKDKRIGIIANSIKDMREYAYQLNGKAKYLYHHAQLDDHERLENEDKIYNEKYNILISNDIVSMSLDIDFDILVMDVSDRLNMNIQRMGRNNRRNKKVSFVNIYLKYPENCPTFICESKALEQFELLTENKILTYKKVHQIKSMIEPDELPTVNYIINDYWVKLKDEGKKENLREIPYTFKLPIIKTVAEYIKGEKILKEIETTRTFKINGEFPWSWHPYDTDDEDQRKTYVHLYGQNYEIINRDKEGAYIIEEFDGYGHDEYEEKHGELCSCQDCIDEYDAAEG